MTASLVGQGVASLDLFLNWNIWDLGATILLMDLILLRRGHSVYVYLVGGFNHHEKYESQLG